MAIIKGFKGIRYNSKKIGDFNKIVAPPYDVINSKEQEMLYQSDPYNVVRLILAKGEGDDRYKNAGTTFKDWLDDSVLFQEDSPSIYPYYQEFEFDGEEYTRKGFIAVVKVEDFETKTILPHEQTFKKHKEDRLRLTTACNANLSQVFTVYPDQDGTVEELIDRAIEEPIIEVTGNDGVKNRFWKISDKTVIDRISDELNNKSLLIADGHHRYETAINYRNQQRNRNGENSGDRPYDYVMMYLSRAEGDGLIINPTHRVAKKIGLPVDSFLQKLEEYFSVEKCGRVETPDLPFNQIVLVLKSSDTKYRLIPKGEQPKSYQNLAVMLLHNLIFKEIVDEESAGILYTKFEDELYDLVENSGYEAGFLLPKLKAGDIFDVVLDGTKMPHKTTYFYPKILSGMVFNPLW